MKDSQMPGLVPVLSRGRHRSPRSGACFMEFASYLAGERWSDHPSCTHPALAHLARGVNDLIGNDARAGLTVLIPSVIGLNAPGERIAYVVAVRAGTAALPIASETRQRSIAVGLQHCLRVMRETDEELAGDLGPTILDALALAPAADAWARRFRAAVGHQAASDMAAVTGALTSVSVVGIAEACVPHTDELLVGVLSETIEHCARISHQLEEVDAPPVSRTADRAFANA